MKPRKDFSTAPLAVIGVDIGKEVFHIVGLGVDGKIAFRKKIRRLGFEDAFEKLPPSIVGMEACLSAHFVSRVLRRLGHEPRIIPAIYVRPFVKGQKNDYNMRRRSPRPRSGRTCVQSKRRARSSSICRPVIAFGRDWCLAGQQRSTRSGPFSSSKG